MEKQVTTAVIPVAGWGTRWLPLTKTIEKCMLPIGSRPAIDWIVWDCVKAGITKVIFVVGENHTQIRSYFSHNASLDQYLTENDKKELLQAVRQPQYEHVRFEYVVQPNDGRYGTAYPVALASEALHQNEPFLYIMGDDFVFRPDGTSELSDFIAAWQKSRAGSAIMTKIVPAKDAVKYGVLLVDNDDHLLRIREKPPLSELVGMESAHLNVGKYIFDSNMVRLTAEYMQQTHEENPGGEYYITDVVSQAAASESSFVVYRMQGEHIDVGTPSSWLAANVKLSQV